MNKKMTKQERNWILYDVGNSAFSLLVTTIMPIYFNSLASKNNISSVNYMAYWGYASSIATVIVAFAGPILGSVTDIKGYKKPIFFIAVITGAIFCFTLGFIIEWTIFLSVFILAKVAFSASLVFYDSMLVDITTVERMDNISSQGYAWGYVGSCIPFMLCLGLLLGGSKMGVSSSVAMTLSFVITAVWWLLFTLPLIRQYKQLHYVEKHRKLALTDSFARIGATIRNIKKEKNIFVFLLAFFFYIDGVYTIVDMATAYGSALGLDSTALLLALLLTQFVAFPFALLFGKFAQKYRTDRLIMICIFAYFLIAVYAIFLHQEYQFWILAICVGMFQGGIQALSRSYFTKIIPADRSGEYFGIYDICGKGAAFMGVGIVSVVSQLTNNISLGVAMISLIFVVGMILFRKAAILNRNLISYRTEDSI